MKTMSRATVLTLGWLMAAPGLPFEGVPEGAAQAARPLPAEARNLDRAIAAQRELVEKQTRPADRASALNDLANLLELRGDAEAAFEHYRAAIAEDGGWAPAHFNLALLAYTTGDRKLASSHLKTAIRLEPGNAWAHYQLGRIADDAGNAAAAVEHYVDALSLDTRLAFTDVNPHFAVNRHASEVLLKADRSRVRALPPRTYSEPSRIGGLLLFRSEEAARDAGSAVAAAKAEEAAAAEAEAPEPGLETSEPGMEAPDPGMNGPRRTDRLPDRAVAAEPLDRAVPVRSSETDRDSAAADTAADAADTVDRYSGGADPQTASVERQPPASRGDRKPRVFTREHLRTRTLGSSPTVLTTPSSAAPSQVNPVNEVPGELHFGAPVGPEGGQAPPPASGTFRGGNSRQFQPSARSSAQLETTIRRRAAPAP